MNIKATPINKKGFLNLAQSLKRNIFHFNQIIFYTTNELEMLVDKFYCRARIKKIGLKYKFIYQ